MEIKAYAKINWDLHILGKRPDGYHALDTVMVNVSLFDVLKLEPAAGISMECSDPSLPVDGRNLVIKAAQALAKASHYPHGAKIVLTKNIPSGGGMGGGSSDAAATLLALNTLWNLNWPVERLQSIAAELGSDVAFFLYGGWRRCLGRGEIVEPLEGSEKWPVVHLLLILPQLQVSTPAAYKALQVAKVDQKTTPRNLTIISQSVQFAVTNLQQDVGPPNLGLVNGLTLAARTVEPRLVELQKVLEKKCPGRWLMSGSGAVHFIVLRFASDGLDLEKGLMEASRPGLRVLRATTFTPLI